MFPYELFQIFVCPTTAVGTSVHHQRSPVNALSEAVDLKVIQELWHNLQGKTKGLEAGHRLLPSLPLLLKSSLAFGVRIYILLDQIHNWSYYVHGSSNKCGILGKFYLTL